MTEPTPTPFRYVDEDDFCLSARILPQLPATVLITIEGSDEPQSAHVPVGELPRVLAGIAAAAGLAAPTTAPPVDTDLRDRVTALYDAIDTFQRQHRTTGGLQFAQIRALLAEHLAAALPAPADRAAEWRAAADALDNSDRLRDFTDDHMSDVNAAADELRRLADEAQQPETEAHVSDADRIVAYRNTDRPGVLLCRMHGEGWAGLTPLTSEDLPDGGFCTWPGSPRSGPCHRDVLAAPAPSEEPK